ncbi:hypothetical protein EBU58_02340 [bacterium]|nr:hypothetical protein [bacterium]
MLAESIEDIDPRKASSITVTDDVVVRVGRYGPFIEDAEGRRASLPPEDTLPPDELTSAKCEELLLQAAKGDEPLGECPKTGLPVYAKNGRFGPYVQLGAPEEGGPKPKSSSLLKGMSLETLDLATALRLLELPRTLGNHPESSKEITALNGRYGPYITCDGDSRSLPAELSPLDVTLEQAVDLLKQPKLRGKRAAPAALKTLGGREEEDRQEGFQKEIREEKGCQEEGRQQRELAAFHTTPSGHAGRLTHRRQASRRAPRRRQSRVTDSEKYSPTHSGCRVFQPPRGCPLGAERSACLQRCCEPRYPAS